MIRLDKDGDLWTLTLDRPDKANALTPDMLSEIADIAEGAQVAKCLIITGAGRVFSAGADLDAARAGGPGDLCGRIRGRRVMVARALRSWQWE